MLRVNFNIRVWIGYYFIVKYLVKYYVIKIGVVWVLEIIYWGLAWMWYFWDIGSIN